MGVIKTMWSGNLPGALKRIGLKLRPKRHGYDGYYAKWQDAAAQCTVVDYGVMLKTVLAATLKVKNGEAAYERDSVLFDEIQYAWHLTAALLWAAAKNGGRLHVLDFGGSLGSSYFQNRKFLSHIDKLSWSVVEKAEFVTAGKQHIEDDVLKFFYSIEEAVKNTTPDLILISGVAQYIEDVTGLLEKINLVPASLLLIDRTPVTNSTDNLVCLQRVPAEIYNAKHPIWVLSKDKLIGQLSNWNLISSFPSLDGRVKLGSGKKFKFMGMIFERNG
jgi:putative methyltransferase (TIGR04325 family)